MTCLKKIQNTGDSFYIIRTANGQQCVNIEYTVYIYSSIHGELYNNLSYLTQESPIFIRQEGEEIMVYVSTNTLT